MRGSRVHPDMVEQTSDAKTMSMGAAIQHNTQQEQTSEGGFFMKKLICILMLAFAVLCTQASVRAQTEEPAKVEKKAEKKEKAAEEKVQEQTAPGNQPPQKIEKQEVKSPKSAVAKEEKDPAVGKTEDGKVVYEGSRGAHYYFNDKGDKVYVQDFTGAKIFGKTDDGKTIFEGPRGGHFYYNDKGDKVYIKKKK